MTDAPELFEEDQVWVAKETRASGIAFSEHQAPADAESFDVDGAQVSYRVKKV